MPEQVLQGKQNSQGNVGVRPKRARWVAAAGPLATMLPRRAFRECRPLSGNCCCHLPFLDSLSRFVLLNGHAVHQFSPGSAAAEGCRFGRAQPHGARALRGTGAIPQASCVWHRRERCCRDWPTAWSCRHRDRGGGRPLDAYVTFRLQELGDVKVEPVVRTEVTLWRDGVAPSPRREATTRSAASVPFRRVAVAWAASASALQAGAHGTPAWTQRAARRNNARFLVLPGVRVPSLACARSCTVSPCRRLAGGGSVRR